MSDIELAPVFKISEIVGSQHPFKIEIFKNKPLTILFPDPVEAIAYQNLNFDDNSTDTDFNITLTGLIKTVEDASTEGKKIEIIISGSKDLVEVQDRDNNDDLLFDDEDQPIMVMRNNGTFTINYKDKDGNLEYTVMFTEFLVENAQIYN